MRNEELKKDYLSHITKKTFKEAIFLAFRDGITSVAPLGFSGDDIILHCKRQGDRGRASQVSIRNYSGDAELLITDRSGSFLFYGRYDINLGVEFVLNEYWRIFKKLRSKINKTLPKRSEFSNIKEAENVSYTVGFQLMNRHQLGFI